MLPRMLLASACLCAPAWTSAAAANPTPDQASAGSAAVEALDAMIDMMKESIWRLPSALGDPPPDASGNTLEGDLAEYLMSDAVLQEIATIRGRMVSAVGEDGALTPELSAPLQQILEQENCRALHLTMYWAPERHFAYHDGMVERLRTLLPADEAIASELAALRGRIGHSRQTMLANIAECAEVQSGTEDSWSRQRDEIRAEYTSLRVELAARVDAAVAAGQIAPLTLEREAACPEAPEIQAGADRNARVRSMPDVGRFYPAQDRFSNIEGIVRVYVEWDATGCVTRSSVTGSSGSQAMDQAALRAALGLEMHPGIVDGKPQADGAVLPLRFSLRGPTEPEPQPQP